MLFFNPNIFIQMKSRDPAQVQALVFMQTNEFLIEPEWCTSRGEAQQCALFFANEPSHNPRHFHTAFVGTCFNNYFHWNISVKSSACIEIILPVSMR